MLSKSKLFSASRSMNRSLRSLSLALAATAILAAACVQQDVKATPGGPPVAKGTGVAETTADSVAERAGATARSTPSAGRTAVPAPAAIPGAAAPTKPATVNPTKPAASRGDSARAATAAANAELTAVMPAGRTAQDRSSFLGTIRSGAKAEASWPTPPTPLPGAILPAKRIIAFYGNPLSRKMGVLGEYPTDVMLAKLDSEVAKWRKADPATPVQPALHLIAVVAQGSPGRDGKYRLRMDSALIERVYSWAQQRNALLFLDIQVAKSTVQEELPRLLPFLSRPNVHLGLDPEFAMHYEREGLPPGKKVGEMHAADVDYAVHALADLVAKNHLPPKVLVVHRWTKKMMPDAEQIRIDPRVQIVMDMDGWGPPWLKFDSYRDYIVDHPVQYTGFKLFFHNDTKKEPLLITPAELLKLRPRPLYIQYQ